LARAALRKPVPRVTLVNAPHLVALARVGARFERGHLVERPVGSGRGVTLRHSISNGDSKRSEDVTMPGLRVTHVLFDFFGTLVEHSPSGAEHGFRRSHDLMRTLGVPLTYDEFLAAWSKTSAQFAKLSDIDHREYSMTEIGTACLREVLGRAPARTDVDQLVHTYLSEWNRGVRHLPGIGGLLTALASEYRLAVVSNTQEADLVPGHLEAMGVQHLFDTVVTSFEVGWRKPHPTIYTTALNELGITPGAAVFVGDTYEADYRGPLQAGIPSLLIDPHSRVAIPHEARLSSIFELPARLAALN